MAVVVFVDGDFDGVVGDVGSGVGGGDDEVGNAVFDAVSFKVHN